MVLGRFWLECAMQHVWIVELFTIKRASFEKFADFLWKQPARDTAMTHWVGLVSDPANYTSGKEVGPAHDRRRCRNPCAGRTCRAAHWRWHAIEPRPHLTQEPRCRSPSLWREALLLSAKANSKVKTPKMVPCLVSVSFLFYPRFSRLSWWFQFQNP